MLDVLTDYFDALERLKKGRPINVPKGTRITNDAVSLEAGRKKGTIKKSRPIFGALLGAIDAAKIEATQGDRIQERLAEAKAEAARYRSLWEGALAREVSLIKQLCDEQDARAREKAVPTGGKVTPIRKSLTRGLLAD
ncbi:MAG TPA: hypothetical protein VLC92_14250 [Rhodocyclaceae bacterium]|nr:hypothetical protein [Rhodocyclaceae bacterium]